MSFSLFGLGVSGGIAMGRAHLISHALLEVAQFQVSTRRINAEVKRFDQAIFTVAKELSALRREAEGPGVPAELSAFIDIHALILEDPLLCEAPKDLIRVRRCNAEWALVQQMDELVAQFEEIEDSYLRERKQDVIQVVERVLKALQGKLPRLPTKLSGNDEPFILVGHDLSPADTIQYKAFRIGGFVTDLGGATSHTAIVARSLGVPALVGMHHARSLIRENDLLIIDGGSGALIVAPTPDVVDEYQRQLAEQTQERTKLKHLLTARSITLDDIRISLQANIELPDDVHDAVAANAGGIGLFRTEFLFMNRDTLPSEEEQYEAYRSVVEAMRGRPVTIRTLDIGADKNAQALRYAERPSQNPALGLRAIRFCLAEPQLFITQLRALLRAANHGRLRILLPMLAHVKEIEQTLMMIWLAKEQLRAHGIPFEADVALGGMIEIPAAALALNPFLKRLHFLSIGTNDLVQYTLAIDRGDDAVAHLYDPLHPAVLQLIARTISAADRAQIPVSVCGEMAGDPKLTRLLLGLGLREFSMHPARILDVKQQIILADCEQLATRVQRLMHTEEPEKIRAGIEAL
jgi:phosphotransferase system enzyme I (PtsI)